MTPLLWLWKKSMRAWFHTGIDHERQCLARDPTVTPAGNSLGPQPARQHGRGQFALFLAACILVAPGCTSWGDYWRNHMREGPAYQRPVAPVEPEWIDADDQQFGLGRSFHLSAQRAAETSG
jgi:hypothetical protein